MGPTISTKRDGSLLEIMGDGAGTRALEERPEDTQALRTLAQVMSSMSSMSSASETMPNEYETRGQVEGVDGGVWHTYRALKDLEDLAPETVRRGPTLDSYHSHAPPSPSLVSPRGDRMVTDMWSGAVTWTSAAFAGEREQDDDDDQVHHVHVNDRIRSGVHLDGGVDVDARQNECRGRVLLLQRLPHGPHRRSPYRTTKWELETFASLPTTPTPNPSHAKSPSSSSTPTSTSTSTYTSALDLDLHRPPRAPAMAPPPIPSPERIRARRRYVADALIRLGCQAPGEAYRRGRLRQVGLLPMIGADRWDVRFADAGLERQPEVDGEVKRLALSTGGPARHFFDFYYHEYRSVTALARAAAGKERMVGEKNPDPEVDQDLDLDLDLDLDRKVAGPWRSYWLAKDTGQGLSRVQAQVVLRGDANDDLPVVFPEQNLCRERALVVVGDQGQGQGQRGTRASPTFDPWGAEVGEEEEGLEMVMGVVAALDRVPVLTASFDVEEGGRSKGPREVAG
jgi:hypothetical protein